jgi:hypothetical protein
MTDTTLHLSEGDPGRWAPESRLRMRHPHNGSVVDLYMPCDVQAVAAVCRGLGEAGFLLLSADNKGGDPLEPPVSLEPREKRRPLDLDSLRFQLGYGPEGDYAGEALIAYKDALEAELLERGAATLEER